LCHLHIRGPDRRGLLIRSCMWACLYFRVLYEATCLFTHGTGHVNACSLIVIDRLNDMWDVRMSFQPILSFRLQVISRKCALISKPNTCRRHLRDIMTFNFSSGPVERAYSHLCWHIANLWDRHVLILIANLYLLTGVGSFTRQDFVEISITSIHN
jgi:hypothetical protein